MKRKSIGIKLVIRMGVSIIDLVWCSGRRAEMKWEVLKIKLKLKRIKRLMMEILFVGGKSPRRP